MVDRRGTPIVIGLIVGFFIIVAGTLYYTVAFAVPGGRLFQVIILGITVALLVTLTYVVWQRVREMKEENPDDYRKY